MITFIKLPGLYLISLTILQVSCDDMKPPQKKQDSPTSGRIQKVVQRDSKGMIVKTYNGFSYRVFDEKGRLIESYGNPKQDDNSTNFRTLIEFTDSVVIVKQYFFGDENTDCVIIDSLDCHIAKFYYKKKKFVKSEMYNPVKDSNGKVTGHKLFEVDTENTINPFIEYLPKYLR